ncbi:MAG: T9SS type A sorting domain-containing protein, partial [Bacteroidia bacterium]|nr:T9SS type A sorting domain-containing protein [Bacteroidia bacterium]
IHTEGDLEISDLQIINMFGAKCRFDKNRNTNNMFQIDITDLDAGMYIVKFQNQNHLVREIIIVQ